MLLKKKLESTVGKQFDEHQQSASKQLDELRSRLDKLEKEISERAGQRSEIIEKRMDELLSQKSPDFQVGSGTVIIKDGPASGTATLKLSGKMQPQLIIQGKDSPDFPSGTQKPDKGGEGSGGGGSGGGISDGFPN